MITKTFNKQQLNEFILSAEFSDLENLPISFHRAISQINNPRLEESDIILCASFDGNKTVGYLGVIPDYIFSNNKKIKFGWLSCFWVDNNYKNSNIAANLFLRTIRAWDKKIMITNFIPSLEKVYQKTKIFKPTQTKIGLRCYYNLNLSKILPQKHTFFAKNIRFLNLVDYLFNFCWKYSFKLFSFSLKTECNYKLANLKNHKLREFIDASYLMNLPKRNIEEYEWILNYPWVLEKKQDSVSEKYHFTSQSDIFKTIPYEIYDKNQVLIGFFILNQRDKDLTIPYFYVENNFQTDATKFIINYVIKNNCSMLTCFNNDLISKLKKNRYKFIFQKEVKKPYLISKDLIDIDINNFESGDGDCVFY